MDLPVLASCLDMQIGQILALVLANEVAFGKFEVVGH
jgi:hypothetical protein